MLFDLISGARFDFVQVIIYLFSAVTVIFITMPVHEFAHAFAAYKLGDNSQKYQGRLTLNPFSHIDWMGALCIILVGFGWAKPVQVNGYNFKNPKRDMALTAFAGPFANLVVCFVSLFLYYLFIALSYKTLITVFVYVGLFFSYIAQINVSLAVFNLIPVPPLDGSKLLAAILPDRIYYKFMQYERYLYFAVILLIFSGLLDGPMYFITNHIISAFSMVASLPFRIF